MLDFWVLKENVQQTVESLLIEFRKAVSSAHSQETKSSRGGGFEKAGLIKQVQKNNIERGQITIVFPPSLPFPCMRINNDLYIHVARIFVDHRKNLVKLPKKLDHVPRII